jgi:hypothetical protein
MRASSRGRRALGAGLLIAMAGTVLVGPNQAGADPGKIPDGTRNFNIVGGSIALGTGPSAVVQGVSHPDIPVECNDTVDNETGTFQGTSSGNPTFPAADSQIDYGGAAANEADTEGCKSLTDDSELFDRNGGTYGNGLGNDVCQVVLSGGASCGTIQLPSIKFNDGSGSATGQPDVDWRVNSVTVSGSAASAPAANLQASRGYLVNGTCQSLLVTVCGSFIIQLVVTATAPISGVTNLDGSGTITIPVSIQVRAVRVEGSNGLIPANATCTTTPSLTLTTETSGSLAGTRYDTFRSNFRVVKDNQSVLAMTTTAGSATVCDSVNTALGLPDPDAEFEFIITDQSLFGPQSVFDVSVNGSPVQSNIRDTTAAATVNEGDVVNVSSTDSYDPAYRTFTVNSLSRTGGTGPAPVATKGAGTTNQTFVAPDYAPAANTHVYTGNVTVNLGPGTQTQSDANTATITVNNVAPTADAGRDRTATGGSSVTLEGVGADPGDKIGDLAFCWTQIGGPSVGLPACSGSPSNNGRIHTFTAPNSDSTLTFQVAVDDGEGGAAATDSVTVTTKDSASGTISGRVTTQSGGLPIAGAKVDLFDSSGAYLTTQVADSNGDYAFAGLAGVDYAVRFRATGYDPQYYSGRSTRDSAIERRVRITPPFSVADGALAATGGLGTIDGTIGLSQAGVAVTVFDLNDEPVDKTLTDSLGAFSIPRIADGQYKVKFAGGGVITAWWNNKVKAAQSDAVTISGGSTATLNPTLVLGSSAGSVSGTIGTITGTTDVRVYKAADGSFAGVSFGAGAGAFSVPGLAPGAYKVWFMNGGGTIGEWYNDLPGFAGDGTDAIADTVTVPSGGTVSLGTVNL